MRRKAAIRILTSRPLLALAATALAFSSTFLFQSGGSRSSAQIAKTATATTSLGAVKVDPLLLKYFASSAAGSVAPAVVTYRSLPTAADFSRLQSIGINKGIAMRKLPMVVVPLNAAQLAALKAQPNVRSVWANRVMKTFTNESRRFIGVPQTMADTEVTRANPQAPGVPVSGKGIGIGYIDTGCDATHADLKYGSKVVQNVIQPTANVQAGDPLVTGLGINVFDIFYSAAGFYAPVYLEDQQQSDIESGHGTFGAAVAAGTGVQSGNFYGGVAAGAHLVCVQSGNEMGLSTIGLLGAYDYMMVNQYRYNIRVINNSWGTTLASSPESLDPADPINVATRNAHDLNMVVVFACGNGIDNVGDVPGAINPYSTMPWVISVAAGYKRGLGQPTDFSSRGENNGTGADVAGQPADPSVAPNLRPDITAPGIDIKSARMKGAGITNTAGLLPIFVGSNDPWTIPPAYLPFYTTSQGTSFSCPHVSGVVALMLEAKPTLTPDEVVTILRETATPMPYSEREVGAGYADAHNAVRRAMGLSAIAHPFNLFPDPNGPEILDPEGDQVLGSGIDPAGTTDAQDIISADYAYDAANRQIVYTLTLKNASLRTEGNSWLMSSNFGDITIYVTATASDVGTMSYSYGMIDNSLAVPSQDDIGDADSGEVTGNQIVIRLSVDKVAAAIGQNPVGAVTTSTEARAQVGIFLLFASDTANGANFKVE